MDAIARHPLVRRRWPALAEAAALVGAWPIQCRATLGGNLANASPAADAVPPLLVADAAVRVASRSGERTIALERFFRGPGATVMAPGGFIVAVLLPAPSAGRVVERFVKVGPRRRSSRWCRWPTARSVSARRHASRRPRRPGAWRRPRYGPVASRRPSRTGPDAATRREAAERLQRHRPDRRPPRPAACRGSRRGAARPVPGGVQSVKKGQRQGTGTAQDGPDYPNRCRSRLDRQRNREGFEVAPGRRAAGPAARRRRADRNRRKGAGGVRRCTVPTRRQA